MIHPCLGHSDKVTMLNDFEFRVWTQYLLSADDFGVMRFSAITLQSDNDSLQERSLRRVVKALDKIVSLGLISTFTHQGRAYACQLNWVKYQDVQYPRHTMHPSPPADLIEQMEPTTQTLFRKHPGGVGRPKKAAQASEGSSEPFGTVVGGEAPKDLPKDLPNGISTEKELARARPGETLTLTLTQAPTLTQTLTLDDELVRRIGDFSERYPLIFSRVRSGAHYRGNPVRDYPNYCELVRGWPDDRLDQMLELFLLMPTKDANNVPGTPGQFLNMAPECDRRLREHGR